MTKNHFDNSFLYGGNSRFLEELYEKYSHDPLSVDQEWADLFKNYSDSKQIIESNYTGAQWQKKSASIIGIKSEDSKTEKFVHKGNDLNHSSYLMVQEFRSRGHLLSKLDPLNIEKINNEKILRLDLASYNFSQNELKQEIYLEKVNYGKEKISIEELYNFLKFIYCNKTGYEFEHIESVEEKDWLYNKAEEFAMFEFSNEDKLKIYQDLLEIEGFEQFIHNRFPGAKRFSVEGGDSSILALGKIIEQACENGPVEEVVIGMPHRGRLNVLTKIMGKPYTALLSEFQGNLAHLEHMEISGDVKYHLGQSSSYKTKNNKNVHLSLTSNPSHLEAVNPVVLGKVRAKQDSINDSKRERVLGITLHGDAAFCGQGVVAESLSLSDLDAYTTGGTIHIIVNNQIGFTTLPQDARKSRYPTEFAKIIQAPVIHVNGDKPDDVIKVAYLAEQYRQKYKKDIVIDVVCYRRYGHNEGDEPMFTQPIMYKNIKTHPTTFGLFSQELISNNVITQQDHKNRVAQFQTRLEKAYKDSATYKPIKAEWLERKWSNIKESNKEDKSPRTAISENDFNEIAKAITTLPKDFNWNNKVKKLIESKKEMLNVSKKIDWATAESLAFGSLLLEEIPIRFTGQDVIRGTFSHRHAKYFDQENEKSYCPLNNIRANQAFLEIHNSNLSEFAVMGFEYGYSTVDPYHLTIWEAQFGDFSNGAQIIIDQFISSAETKWLRKSGLVLLLPHGYEGQGPEHSSARLERYLQLCAENNMRVVNCTTPANYFHALRRQIKADTRMPLVVMSPKSLLRHKNCVSQINDFLGENSFNEIIDDNNIKNADKISKVIMCSGKIYYEILEEKFKRKANDIALIRIEQYYPFPDKKLSECLNRYKNAKFYWCQEEPKNMGAWRYICHYIEEVLKNDRPTYIGRPVAASPAAGYMKMHIKEQNEIINNIFK